MYEELTEEGLNASSAQISDECNPQTSQTQRWKFPSKHVNIPVQQNHLTSRNILIIQLVMHYQPRKAWVTNMPLNTIYFADVPNPSSSPVKLSQLSNFSPCPQTRIIPQSLNFKSPHFYQIYNSLSLIPCLVVNLQSLSIKH